MQPKISSLDSKTHEQEPLLPSQTLVTSNDNPHCSKSGGAARTSILWIIVPILGVVFLQAFDGTVVAAISPVIGSQLKSSHRISWIQVAYMLSTSAFQPTYGRLSNIFGRKPCLMFAIVVFLIGTLGCTIAPGIWTLFASRVVAGIGGGGLNVVGVIIVSDTVLPNERGRYMGFLNAAYAIGASLGGLFGGFMTDCFGWRYSFGVQVPVIVEFQRGPMLERLERVDFWGALLLTSSVSTLIIGLNLGGNQLPWSHPLVLTVLPLCATCLIAFLYVERNVATEPITPLHLLSQRTPLAVLLSNCFTDMVLFSVLYNAPLFYQAVLNLSPISSGLRLIPNAIGPLLGSNVYGSLTKRGHYYKLILSAYFLQFLGTGLFATFKSSTPSWEHYIAIVVTCVGISGTTTVLIVALTASVSHEDRATAIGMSYLFRSVGQVVGVTTTQCVLQNLLKVWLTERIQVPNADYIIQKVRESVASIYDPEIVPIGVRGVIVESYVQALRVVFLMTIGFVVLSTLSGSFMKEQPLDNVSTTFPDGNRNRGEIGEEIA